MLQDVLFESQIYSSWGIIYWTSWPMKNVVTRLVVGSGTLDLQKKKKKSCAKTSKEISIMLTEQLDQYKLQSW